jgi:tRNA dimethylallyltransferase
VVLVGTTASGKSDVAFAVAVARPAVEIVSVDSMSVYRGMDVATAKPSADHRDAVRHHLIDLVDPAEEFTVSMFQRAARDALSDIASRRRRALLVGGTGLYVRAVVDDLSLPGRWPEVAAALEREADSPDGCATLYERLVELDPGAASRITPANRRRIVRALEVTIGSGRPFSSFGPGLEAYPPTRFVLIGMPFDAARVDRRIEERFARWMDAGLVDEVRALAGRPAGLSRTARQALGYRELLEHLEDGVPLVQAVERAVGRTRAFARRQWAWFRRDPRIRWVPESEDPLDVLGAALDRSERSATEVGARD